MSTCTDDRIDRDDRDFDIEVAIDGTTRRVGCVYTRGLWWFGFPELYVAPPEEYSSTRTPDDPNLPVFLATALAHLGRALLEADDIDDVEYLDVFEGRPASAWLGPAEPTEGPLLIALPESATSVIRVGCSLWEPAVMRSGGTGD